MLDGAALELPLSGDAPDRAKTPSSTSPVPADECPETGRKRCRSSIGHLTRTNSSPPPPWRRAEKPFQSQEEAEATFYDSLPVVFLTSRALRELDRRNRRSADLGAHGAVPASPARSAQPEVLPGSSAVCSDRIERFTRHGGPDLGDLRDYPNPATSAYTWTPSRYSSKQEADMPMPDAMCNPLKRSSAYDANFDQHLTLNGIYGNFEDPIPANWNDIRQRLARRRPSLSETRFPEKAFKSFARAVHNSTSEQALMGGPLSTVAGKAQFRSSRDMEFGNLRPLTDGTLIEAKPGFFDGADLEELNHRIRSQLGNDVIPSTRPRDPVLPNFFLEGKGPEGRAAGGLLQARYDGALGARGMLTMQGFGAASGPSYDRNAYTITGCFTQFLGMLSLYCIYPTRPKHAGGAPEYHMILLGGWALRANAEQFRAGVAAFRNAREWAKEQRDEVIRAANARVRDVEGEGAGVNPAKPTEGSEPPSSRGRRLRPRPNPQVRAANVLQ